MKTINMSRKEVIKYASKHHRWPREYDYFDDIEDSVAMSKEAGMCFQDEDLKQEIAKDPNLAMNYALSHEIRFPEAEQVILESKYASTYLIKILLLYFRSYNSNNFFDLAYTIREFCNKVNFDDLNV